MIMNDNINIEKRNSPRLSSGCEEVYHDLHEHLRKQEEKLLSILQKHISDEDDLYQKIISSQEDSSKKLEEHSKKIEELVTGTKDLLDTWRATLGAIKVLNTIGNILKWISSISLGILGILSFKEILSKW
jgi:chromosome segregation ATPase